jgi:transcriptional regulator with XRE-family HTH domain
MDELSFGQWLSRQRKSLGLTQKQLAEKVNCATITVRKMEAEQRRPSQQVTERLAQVLSIPIEEKNAFFRYARGDKQPISSITSEDFPWHRSGISFNSDMLASVINHIRHDHILSQMNGIFQDEHIHLINQPEITGNKAASSNPELIHGEASEFQHSIFFIMLIPIGVPSYQAVTLFKKTVV